MFIVADLVSLNKEQLLYTKFLNKNMKMNRHVRTQD